ncbi:phosphonate ABC transporter ATP-binding protein [Marinobacter nanhaiticus D15-8W]|uniref:ATP-binding cassette domain-containing protein n=1 Tax=Marinobacter nanhaiticus D15-8W TaxID=626887 RepID=N6W1U9_9GAMM|nr:ATP-binding cassette domain-containing protein [Marinobacter nanhaiticus]ENO14084.1 ATP-binding cassette domain-containing protein [Marinobacter nanhaiticus D15-8W]BES71466.1 phosphonate ABC transporter ATP-binding protein [Marinobacter nanhaiticus D15-8W]
MDAVHLRNLTAAYGGQQVLGPISLDIRPGEHIALVGRSGAGKSTLLNLLYEQVRDRAALVPQEQGLVQSLSVFHNVYMGRLSANPRWYNILNLVWPRRRELEEISPLLERLGIVDKLRKPVEALSGGQKQRTAVARALYQKAAILLADEPVSALDGPLAHVVMGLISEAYATSVIALHDIDLALRYCDRIVGIRDGQIALDDATRRLSPADILPLY